MKIITLIVSLLVLCLPSDAQSIRTDPLRQPQPNYQQYGSLSRQRQVYDNLRQRNEQMERQRYARWREEVRRQRAAEQQNVIVVRPIRRSRLVIDTLDVRTRRFGFREQRNQRPGSFFRRR